MKLTEIAETQFRISEDNHTWLNSVVTGYWEFSTDGKINVHGSVFMPKYQRVIPVPFGEVSNDFMIDQPSKLESLENSPVKVGRHFNVIGSQIKSLDHLPRWIGGDLNISETPIPDLHNIHKRIDHLGGRFYAGSTDGTMGGELKSHVLGLLLLKPYPKSFWLSGVPEKVNEILYKYVQKESRDIYAAQEELIDAGLEDFGQL